MSTTLIIAIIAINLALVFYTIGVWKEIIGKRLKKVHLIFFYSGLVFDTIGTYSMSLVSKQSTTPNPLHGATGMIAIILMLFHAAWATYVLKSGNEKSKENFHKFSKFVWIIWLIPYFLGVLMGMGL